MLVKFKEWLFKQWVDYSEISVVFYKLRLYIRRIFITVLLNYNTIRYITGVQCLKYNYEKPHYNSHSSFISHFSHL